MSLQNTPNANRLHIAIFGRRNSGKSSLINALTNQETALTSEIAGTTTDPVYKAMELHPIGPCVFIDTAGFDDAGTLGDARVSKTRQVLDKTDIALLIYSDTDLTLENIWLKDLKTRRIPVVPVINKCDLEGDSAALIRLVKETTGQTPIQVSAKTKQGMTALKDAITRSIPEDFEAPGIVSHLVGEKDSVLLVMPQDIQAPKGRLILPQVQTIRELLDIGCIVTSTTTAGVSEALKSLKKPPKLIITDSQVFKTVSGLKPKESLLTSFSVLFAKYKGDIEEFIRGAAAIDRLSESDSVLIAEACTHAPLDGDIARIKLPRMLRQKAGEGLKVDVVSGADFGKDLGKYALIIHCGACMFNRKHVLSRIAQAREKNIPITNYGVAIAKLTGILDKVVY